MIFSQWLMKIEWMMNEFPIELFCIWRFHFVDHKMVDVSEPISTNIFLHLFDDYLVSASRSKTMMFDDDVVVGGFTYCYRWTSPFGVCRRRCRRHLTQPYTKKVCGGRLVWYHPWIVAAWTVSTYIDERMGEREG